MIPDLGTLVGQLTLMFMGTKSTPLKLGSLMVKYRYVAADLDTLPRK